MEEIEKQQRSHIQSLVRPGLEFVQVREPFYGSAVEVPHLLDYWHVIVKRRWAVLPCLFIVFSTIAIGTLKQKPIYEAKVLIEVNPEPSDALNLRGLIQFGGMESSETYRATQFKVLQSRTLAERVIQDLQLYRNPEFIRRRNFFGLIESEPKAPAAPDRRTPDPSSEAYIRSVQHLLDSLEARPVLHTSLVEVSIVAEDPKLAARVANQVASDYIDQNLRARWDETTKASEWLSDELVGLKGKLEESEDALQSYAQANSILLITGKENLGTVRLEQLQAEYTKAQTERFQKESLYKLVQAGKAEELPGVISDKVIQELETRLSDARREYAKLNTTMRPEYPKVAQIRNQIDSLEASLEDHKKLVSQDIVADYKAALAREMSLAQALDQQTKVVNEIATRSIQYNILKREADTNRQLYEGLLQRLKESKVSAGLKASNIRVVDPAQVPRSPVKPRLLMNLAMGLVLGLVLGIGLAFFQEYMDNTLKTPDDIEKILRLPSLGVLPAFSLDGNGKATNDKLAAVGHDKGLLGTPAIQTDPAIVEAFRFLRTSVLLSAEPVPKVILVTSAFPGEGKTTVSVNLGATLASLGSRVLIVDCDMRRPACHRAAGVENKPGFVPCLTGHAELSEAILPVPGVPNLSVIPCGPIPPNPAEILSSPLAGKSLKKLCSEFEYVLVDSPPLLSVADARILSTVTDAVVLVTRAFKTPSGAVRRAQALLYGAGARILGVALNNVDLSKDGGSFGYYSYRYGYGYGYGYGSGQDDTRESFSEDDQRER